jgi:hypothetical protein
MLFLVSIAKLKSVFSINAIEKYQYYFVERILLKVETQKFGNCKIWTTPFTTFEMK